VVAHVALVRRVRFRVDVQRVVGTCVHARLAANAIVVLEVDDAVVRTEQRRGRADRHARRVFALVAPHDVELAGDVGEGTGLDVLDPRSIDAERHVVFALAGNGASMTANAVVTVEKKAEFGHVDSLPRLAKP